jgi:hypothetical protein
VGVRPQDVEIGDTGTVAATVHSTGHVGAGGVSCTVAGVRVSVAPPVGPRPAIGSAVRLRLHHHVVFDRAGDRTISG